MKPLIKHLLILVAFVAGVCNVTQARPDEATPARRINIAVADNKSVYTTVNERNNYENLLRLQQPDGLYQLTAGMLNDGDNHIVFHRIDDQGIDTTIARINLNAQIVENKPTIIDSYDFTEKTPLNETTVTQAMLSGGWGTDGENLIWQTNGSAYVAGLGGLTFTMPAGYHNVVIQLIAYVGPNIRGGYFTTNYNNSGWTMAAQVSGKGAYVVKTFTGVNGGDVINIYGGLLYNGSYYLGQSPDIEYIAVRVLPYSYTPNIKVSPSISYNNDGNWSAATSLGSIVTYSPNDTVRLYALGTVRDVFYASTAQNDHPGYYNYSVAYDANIALPFGGETGLDYYASADFTAAMTSSPTSAEFAGLNKWSFYNANVYTPSAGRCCYLMSYGSIIYTMPRNFMGNTVNVTVTSNTSEDGAGDLYVNGIVHTFTTGETYTWSIPVAANGFIEIKGNAIGSFTNSYSIDFTRIVITSGNGSSMNAPVYHAIDDQEGIMPNKLGLRQLTDTETKELRDMTIKVK